MSVLKAIAAAALFGLSAPISKLLISGISPLMMASLLYLGAGLGMLIIYVAQNMGKMRRLESHLSTKDLPYTLGMIVLDVAAPMLLITGLKLTTSSNAALLGNFEIVATSVIALVIFKEAVGRRLWASIFLITAASFLLAFEGAASLKFSMGSLLVLLACTCWGLENNFTRMLSLKDPIQIVIVKGFGSGLSALVIAIAAGQSTWNVSFNLGALLLGFFAYGLSIYLYVSAQRDLGAARTSAYYAVAPFIGVGLSFLIFKTPITPAFAAALLIMVIGSYLAISENHSHMHWHDRLEHEHRHRHDDMHHDQQEGYEAAEEHAHLHVHEEMEHSHKHAPDLHHKHRH